MSGPVSGGVSHPGVALLMAWARAERDGRGHGLARWLALHDAIETARILRIGGTAADRLSAGLSLARTVVADTALAELTRLAATRATGESTGF